MADSREAERQRKLAKKPSAEERRKAIERKLERGREAERKSKAKAKAKENRGSRSKAERNPFNVRSGVQSIMDRRYRNQTTDSNN